jgi:hypothetical protein
MTGRNATRIEMMAANANVEARSIVQWPKRRRGATSMQAKASSLDRRQFLSGVGLTATAGIPLPAAPAESVQGAAPWTGAILHVADGQHIRLSGGRELTIKVDSQLTPGVRMSMVTEDLPPGAQIQVHLPPC